MTHQPNTPRARNSKGQKVEEPVQCVQCLQAWPCEVMLLSQQIIALASENRRLREALAAREDDDEIEPDYPPGYQGDTL